ALATIRRRECLPRHRGRATAARGPRGPPRHDPRRSARRRPEPSPPLPILSDSPRPPVPAFGPCGRGPGLARPGGGLPPANPAWRAGRPARAGLWTAPADSRAFSENRPPNLDAGPGPGASPLLPRAVAGFRPEDQPDRKARRPLWSDNGPDRARPGVAPPRTPGFAEKDLQPPCCGLRRSASWPGCCGAPPGSPDTSPSWDAPRPDRQPTSPPGDTLVLPRGDVGTGQGAYPAC